VQVDYFERAKRLVEIPLIHSWYEEQDVKDRKYHDEQQEAAVSPFKTIFHYAQYLESLPSSPQCYVVYALTIVLILYCTISLDLLTSMHKLIHD